MSLSAPMPLWPKRLRLPMAMGVALAASIDVLAVPSPSTPTHVPDAIVDLATPEGVALVQGQWRTRNADIVGVDHRAPGPDLKASGAPQRTHDVEPKAGAVDFDDRAWEAIDATTLEARRSTGRLAFTWYRLGVTIPEKVGEFQTAGSTVVFEIVMDDYAEIWVDGKLPQVAGQAGGHMVAGWNAPNRVVIGRDVRPGQKIQLAIFAMNGPVSHPPANFIWIRSATLDFYRPRRWLAFEEVAVDVIRHDPLLDSIIPWGAKLQRIAAGFTFTEGPVWVPEGEGYLLFSEPNNNVIHRWSPDGGLSVFRTKSGYKGADISQYGQPGSNGLALDREGRLSICEHGNRRVTRLEKNGVLTVLADRYEGKRLNSPNDLVYRSDGALYFSDPPFGLPKFHEDPRRELDFCGVFCLIEGRLKLVSRDFQGPNGLAFSPDEKYLYVCNWDESKKVVYRYEPHSDGTLSNGKLFFDMGGAAEREALDGLKVDRNGHVLVSGPGGIWILSPEGKHLGTIRGPELPANFAFGEPDGKTLFMTARTGLYRMRLVP